MDDRHDINISCHCDVRLIMSLFFKTAENFQTLLEDVVNPMAAVINI